MTSKEALEIVKKYDDFVMARYVMAGVLSAKTIGSPSKVEFDEAIKTIEKDLEALEVLKKYLYVNHFITYDNLDYAICLDLMENSETEKIKEWLDDK